MREGFGRVDLVKVKSLGGRNFAYLGDLVGGCGGLLLCEGLWICWSAGGLCSLAQ